MQKIRRIIIHLLYQKIAKVKLLFAIECLEFQLLKRAEVGQQGKNIDSFMDQKHEY